MALTIGMDLSGLIKEMEKKNYSSTQLICEIYREQ